MKLYAVRNKAGKYFRSRGLNQSSNANRDQWVEFNKAKFYTTIGQAKGRATFFYNLNPDLGKPDVLEYELKESSAVVKA